MRVFYVWPRFSVKNTDFVTVHYLFDGQKVPICYLRILGLGEGFFILHSLSGLMFLRLYLIALFSLGVWYASWSQPELTLEIVDRQLKEVKPGPDILDSLNRVAFSYWFKKPEITEKYGRFTLKEAENLAYQRGIANSNSILGISMWARDLYDEALEHYFIALPIYDELGEERRKANVFINIGNIYDDQGLFKQSKSYHKQAINIFLNQNDTLGLVRSYNNIGSAASRSGDYDSGRYYYQLSYDMRKLIDDSVGMARVLNNVAEVFNLQGDHQSALDRLMVALAINSRFDDYNLQSTIYESIGRSLRKLGKIQLAKQYLDSALTLSLKIDTRKTQILVYEELAKIEEALGNEKAALDYLKQFVQLNEEVYGEETQTRTDRLQLRYQTLFAEKKVNELEASETEAKLIRNIVIVLLISALIIGFLIFNRQRLSIRQKRIEAENALLREKELRAELEQKQRELASYAFNFVQKGQLLEELRGKIKDLRGGAPDEVGSREFNQLIKVIDSSSIIDKDWEDFKLRFEEVHQDFFQNLKQSFPDLTASDLKICALLKLNMNMKEAARVLGISPDSVKISRYRLRKKLGLTTEENLNDFILNFGVSLN